MDELTFFINQLEDADFSVRLNAINMLGEFQDPRAVEPLLKLLSDDEWQIRNAAIEAIANIKDKSIVDTVANYLRADDANLRNAAMQALEKMGEDVLEPLCANLKDKDTDVRIFAANTLGNIKDEKAVPALIEAMNDEDENVFYAVVEALGRIGDKRALKELMHKLNEKDIWDRFVIITTLGSIGDETVVPELIKQLEFEELKIAVLEALSEIAFEGTLPIIVEIINTDEDFDVKVEALKALFNIVLKTYNFARIERNNILQSYLLENMEKVDFRSLTDFILEIFESQNNDLKDKILRILNWANVKFPIKPIVELLKIEELEEQAYELLIKQNDIPFESFKNVYENEEDVQIKALLIKSLAYYLDESIHEFIEDILNSNVPELVLAASEALMLHFSDISANDKLIDKLFNLLKNRDEEIRRAAKNVLIILAYTENVKSKLEKSINNSDIEIVKETIEIISISNCIDLLDNIIDLIDSEDAGIRLEVFKSLHYLSKIEMNKKKILEHPKADKIYEGIFDKNDDVKIEAIITLGSIGDDKAWNKLKDALFDSSFGYFRHYIVRAMKEFRDKDELVDVLIELMNTGVDIETKLTVINTFRDIGSSKPVEYLSDILFEEFEDDIKSEILLTIGVLGSEEDVDYLIPFLEEDNWFLKNSAVLALSNIKDDEAKNSLIQVIEKSDKVEDQIIVKNAIKSLQNYTDKDVVDELLKYISDVKYYFVIYETLYKIFNSDKSLINYALNVVQDNIIGLRFIISLCRELLVSEVKDKLIDIYHKTTLESIRFSIIYYLKVIEEDITPYCEVDNLDTKPLIKYICNKFRSA